MVVAPLTVTTEREEVIDFSMPFLSFNRIDRTAKKETQKFAFLRPLSKEAWVCIQSYSR